MAVRAALLVALAGALVSVAAAQPRLIDDFETSGGWKATAFGGSRAQLSWERDDTGSALRLDYDLANASGFVIVRKEIALTLPENFAFTFRIRGEGPPATFEFKVVGTGGRNVWWRRQPDFSFPREWQTVIVRRSRLAFAWGPDGGGDPREIGAIEIAIGGGTPGAGTVWIGDLRLEPREPAEPDGVPLRAQASSSRPDLGPELAIDRSPLTRWRSETEAEPQWLLLDFGSTREYGGLVIDWDPLDFAVAYTVETSPDGEHWTTAFHTQTGKGGRAYVYMPDAESRYLRLNLHQSSRGRGFGITDVDVQPVTFSESPNAFFTAIAYESPPGFYPKYLGGKQTYWTVVGVDAGTQKALVNQEGMVEVDRAFSIEPFLYTRGTLVTWNDVQLSQELADGALPIPTVVWRYGGLRLRVTAFADGPPDASTLYLRYRVENQDGSTESVRLFAAIRPFQVTPPWQSLNMQGGVTSIREVRYDGRAVWVDRVRAVVPLVPPASFGAATFEDGSITDFLSLGEPPEEAEVSDPFGFASAALGFQLQIAPGATAEAAIAVPLHESTAEALPSNGVNVDALQEAVRLQWARRVGRVDLVLPPSARVLERTLRSTLAYTLVNRSGPALRPGSRNYARSWIRDGALESAALLEMGFTEEVRDFLRWYVGFQAKDGRIPCCVDSRGPDWTVEHDSIGAFVYALAEYYRYTRDVGFVHDLWSNVVRAIDRLKELRAQRTTPEYRTPERQAFYGLLPESISHEGYAGHPVHSYWDDFLALRGLKDAAMLAVVVGDEGHAVEFAKLRDEFSANLLASLDVAMTQHGIDYLPGSVELGDFDPTSTSIAIFPGGELDRLPADALRRTYERYWQEIATRQRGEWPGQAYSPYELRNVTTFVRLGWRDRAQALLDYLMTGRRPVAWNEWAEVVWLDRGLPRFIGDMPHTWVAAGFVHAIRHMLAYERETDQALVIGAGIRPEWVTSEGGMSVRRLPTHWGILNYTMRADGPDVVRVRVSGDLVVPPGKIELRSPLARRIERATLDGLPVTVTDGERITLDRCPADLDLWYAPQAR